MKKHFILSLGVLLSAVQLFAQGEKETNLIADGNQVYQDEAYTEAEAAYRKALSINSVNTKSTATILGIPFTAQKTLIKPINAIFKRKRTV